MFESRMNQVSDQFSRDFNGKATVTYHGSGPVKETYITDTELPNFKTMNNFGKHMENDIRVLDRKFDRDYNVDYRIQELEKNAEEAYGNWRKSQEKLDEEKRREKSLKDFRERLQAEKDQLQGSLRAQEQPDQYQGYNTMKSGYDYSLAASGVKFHGSESWSPERRNLRETGGFDHANKFTQTAGKMHERDLRASSEGFKTLKAQNDDFNFHQLDMNRTTGKNFHYHDESINYQNIDVEKLEAASKHCGACEAKYKLLLNMVNPYKEKQRITDEAIRKILIKLKGLFMSKRFEEAQDLVETSLGDGYRHADIYYMAGEVKRALGLYKEAEAYYLQALTFQVHSPYIYQSLGLTYINLGNHKRAIPLLKHFTDKIVSDSACFELAKSLAVCKSYLEATVYFGKAIEINSKIGDYYLHRGDSYEALGFMKLAIDDYRAFRKMTPNYREMFEKNIKDLERQGKFEEANSFKVYMRKIAV